LTSNPDMILYRQQTRQASVIIDMLNAGGFLFLERAL